MIKGLFVEPDADADLEPPDRAPQIGESDDNQDPAKRFPLVPFDKIKMSSGPTYLVKGLIPRVGLVIVWGPPKCGKSFWVFDLMMHVALDWPYRGLRVKAGPVVYCTLEGAEGFKRRVEAFRRHRLSEEAAGIPFHLMSASLDLIREHDKLITAIRVQLKGARPSAIVIDTLNRSLVGSESSDEDMAAYMRAAAALERAFDCVIPIIHHCGHNGERPRGHSSLGGALEVQIAVKRDAAENIVATLELAKDAEPGLTFVSRLVVVDLGNDEDGDPITSCVVEPADETCKPTEKKAAAKPKRHLPKSAGNALRALDKAIAEVGEAAPTSNHIPASARVVTVDQWQAYAFQMGISNSRPGTSEADQDRARRKAFKSAVETLSTEDEIVIWGMHVWKTG
jgi:hypothetical protein